MLLVDALSQFVLFEVTEPEYLIDCTGSPAGLPASVFGPPTAPRLWPDLGNLRRVPCVTVAVPLVCGRRETKVYTQLT